MQISFQQDCILDWTLNGPGYYTTYITIYITGWNPNISATGHRGPLSLRALAVLVAIAVVLSLDPSFWISQHGPHIQVNLSGIFFPVNRLPRGQPTCAREQQAAGCFGYLHGIQKLSSESNQRLVGISVHQTYIIQILVVVILASLSFREFTCQFGIRVFVPGFVLTTIPGQFWLVLEAGSSLLICGAG